MASRMLTRTIPLMLYLGGGMAHAQPVLELLGGGTVFVAENDGGASNHGNDSTLGGVFAVGIAGRESRVGGQFEGSLHKTMTRLDPGFAKHGRVTYVYNRRDYVWSFLGRVDTAKTSSSPLRVLGGLSLVRTYDGGFTMPRAQSPTYRPPENRLAWTFGADLVARTGRFVIIAPRFRMHVVAIGRHEPMFAIGAAAGWNLPH